MSQQRLVPWQEAGVVSTNHSPHAQLHPVPIRAVHLEEGFWKPRLATNLRVSLPKQLDLLRQTGTLENFKRLYGASPAERQGFVFADSDVYKWIEAASFALQSARGVAEMTVWLQMQGDAVRGR